MKKGQMTIILKRMLSYGLILCLVAGITDVYSLSANAKEVMQGQQVYAEGASERAGADGADDTEVIPGTENQEEVETGEDEEESPDEEPIVEDEEGSDIVDGDDSDAGEEEEVTEETPSEVVYDPQPTNRQEVESIINAFQGAWEEAVAAGGDLEAVLATKPHWQFEVPGEWMPGGYRCERVEDDAEFGNGYYTFFVGNVPTANYFISDFATLKHTIESSFSNLDIEITGGIDFMDSITVPAGITVTLHSTAGSNFVLLQTASTRHFVVHGQLNLKEITLDGGSGSAGSYSTQGGIHVTENGTIVIENGALIQNCRARGGGYDSPITNSDSGGAVRLQAGAQMIMNGGTISDNTASSGGGVYADSGGQINFTMNGGKINNNSARSMGGGVSTSTFGRVLFTVNGGEINNNSAGYAGGGVYTYGGPFIMTGGTISGNTSVSLGGGICFGRFNSIGGTYGAGNIKLSGGIISDNTSGTGGGILVKYWDDPSLPTNYIMHIDGIIITKNKSTYGGAGIFMEGGPLDIIMDSGEISNNISSDNNRNGGGLYFTGQGSFTINDGAIVNNQSNNSGGGIAILSPFFMNGGSINNNKSKKEGGGIYIASSRGSFEISGGEIKGNETTSRYSGAGIYWGNTSDSTTGSISGCTISDNKIPGYSSNGGAGIYTANTTYVNLEIAGDVVFSGNVSGTGSWHRQPPEDIASIYPNIRYAQTSFSGTGILQPEHVLNDVDINYIPTSVAYSPNGGYGSSYDKIVDSNSTYTVLGNSNANLGYVKNGSIFNGWNTQADGGGTAYVEGDQFTPSAYTTLYAQWLDLRKITIGNNVSGTYANMDKIFAIQIVLKDGSGTPVSRTLSYTGDSTVSGVPAPASGSLTLDAAGSATIQLKHGQAITLEPLPAGYQYQVIESVSSSANYSVTYNGTVSTTGFSDTIADSDVTVVIENTRNIIPSTGVDEGGSGTGGLLLSGTAIFAVGMLSLYYFRKRNRESV